MTKSEYRSYISNLLPQVDQTNKYHPNVIDMAITTAQEQLFNELYKKGELKDLSQFTKKYTATRSVAETGWQEMTFSSMGASPISIERKSSGITRITNVEQASSVIYAFKPTDHQEYHQMGTNELSNYSDVIWYIVESDRILVRDDSLLQFVTNFNIYMIPKFYDLSSSDKFNFPRGYGHLMTRYIMEMLGIVPPKDLVSDNTDA